MSGGAPKGNNNYLAGRRWKDAIIRALERRSKGEGIQELDNLADRLIDGALAGDIAFIKEFGDRMDGKSTQATEISGPEGGALQVKTVVNFVAGNGGT